MPKAIKITPNSIEEIDHHPWKDPYHEKKSWDCFCLHQPLHWEHKRFRLCAVIHGRFQPHDEYNPLATEIWQKLRCRYQPVDMKIFGIMFITNENEDDIIDFVRDDLEYIIDKMQNSTLKYREP